MAIERPDAESTFKDYYQILRLHPDAEAVIVDQVYWHLARLYNAAIPDDSSFKDKLEDLNEAYSVLRSSELRRQYNQRRDAVLGKGTLPSLPEPEPEPPPLAVMTKQHAQPRDEPHPRRRWTARFGIPRRWQTLVRKVTALPSSATLHLSAIRAPRLPERAASTPIDTDTLHQSTEAMRARLRMENEALSKVSSVESADPEGQAAEPPDLEASLKP